MRGLSTYERKKSRSKPVRSIFWWIDPFLSMKILSRRVVVLFCFLMICLAEQWVDLSLALTSTDERDYCPWSLPIGLEKDLVELGVTSKTRSIDSLHDGRLNRFAQAFPEPDQTKRVAVAVEGDADLRRKQPAKMRCAHAALA